MDLRRLLLTWGKGGFGKAGRIIEPLVSSNKNLIFDVTFCSNQWACGFDYHFLPFIHSNDHQSDTILIT